MADYEAQRLGTLEPIHAATADPLRGDLDGFVTYDKELTKVILDIDLPNLSPA